jgi:protocatechuate 3,4-dioxygenase alpha subunit
MDLTPTPSQTVGPYLHLGLTGSRSIPCVAADGVKGERIRLICRVLDGDGNPVDDAMIELWQADAKGIYNHPDDPQSAKISPDFRGFGRMATGEDGVCVFETIKPGRVPGPNGKLQAPHINVSVLGRGLLKRLATRIYFTGEGANPEDAVLASVPENRRSTLLAQADPSHAGEWRFDVRLCGDSETVFFDV